MKNIIIIGGGFAGVHLTKKLSNDNRFDITLIDRNNYNFFSPLIYQVATGFLEPSTISYPFRKLFRGKQNIRFRMGTLQEIDSINQKIMLDDGELAYDYLVLATGTVSNYFGMKNIEDNALPLKTLNDAMQLQNTILKVFEKASKTANDVEKQKMLNIVVAGAGPTGVELSGMFAELRNNILVKDYPEFKGLHPEIYLIDGAPVVLSAMSEATHRDSFAALTKMGVNIKLNMQVRDYIDGAVQFVNGESISTQNLIWAAGVTSQIFKDLTDVAYGRGKRLLVDAFNKLQNIENIYAIGDTCIMTADAAFDKGHPQLAQVAMQQGDNLAINFKKIAANKPPKPFKYFDKGTMAIIGCNKAVVDLTIPKWHFKGFIAWFIWAFIHLISLISTRNKLKTFSNWMVAYFTKDQSLRMVYHPEKK